MIYAICRQDRIGSPGRLLLFKSTDEVNWDTLAYNVYDANTRQSTYYGGYLSALAVHDGTIFIGTSQTEVLVKSPQDIGFMKALNDDNDDIVQFTFSDGNIFASGLRSGLYESTDSGKAGTKFWDSGFIPIIGMKCLP